MKSLSEDWADGVEYGFPMCCILAFINRGGTQNGRQAIDHGVVSNQGNPYFPCGFFHKADRRAEPWEGGVGYTLTTQWWDPVRGYTDGDT